MRGGARRAIALGGLVALGLAVSTLLIGVLEGAAGIPNASTLYIVVVAAVAFRFGIAGAGVTALVAIGVYDFLYTEPRYTLTIAEPGEWLSLLLLLFVAVIVGQLAAVQRRRAEVALARERESRALFGITRALAARSSLGEALPAIAATIADATRATSVWIAFGSDDANERVAAQRGGRALPRGTRSHYVLHGEGSAPTRWTAVRPPTASPPSPRSTRLYRVRIVDGAVPVGSIWAELDEPAPPDGEGSTLLVVAADLVAQAIAQERLDEERRIADVARRSDAVKTALLESVSHSLRTPLASIRASAGTLMDPDVALDDAERWASAASIDAAAARLDRVVGNLLDLSRIEGGALRVTREPVEVEELVARAVAIAGDRHPDRRIRLDVADDLVVDGDPVLLEEALANLLDNAAQHTPSHAEVLVRGSIAGDAAEVVVEDAGPGVPDADLERIFGKFYRAADAGRGGSGVGLAVVRGFAEAMGGRVRAGRSRLGGLAITLELPLAQPADAIEPGEP